MIIPKGNLESIDLHIFGLWEEAAALGGNPHRNMQTPDKKAFSDWPVVKATVLTVESLCRTGQNKTFLKSFVIN